MKASDLMLGNYAYDTKKKTVFEMCPEILSDIDIINDRFVEGEYPLPYVHIAITTEWLEKFGFEEKVDGDVMYWEKNGVKIWDSADEEFYHINSETLIHFDNVSQLQNFYKAITNEELRL